MLYIAPFHTLRTSGRFARLTFLLLAFAAPAMAASLNNLADVQIARGNLTAAEALMQRAVTINEAIGPAQEKKYCAPRQSSVTNPGIHSAVSLSR
jgi:hypothetical protein